MARLERILRGSEIALLARFCALGCKAGSRGFGVTMIVQALTKLDLAEAGSFSGKVDPISLLLKRSVAVYIEVDQSRYLVRTKASAMAVLFSGSSNISGVENDCTVGLSIAPDVLYLRLDDSQIEEIRDFGDSHITVFSRGGLVRRHIAKEHRGAIRGESDDMGALQIVSLYECSLIDKKKWDSRMPSIEFGRELMTSDPFVVGRRVSKKDLFISVVDAQMLRLKGSSNWDCVEYPFKGTPKDPVPPPIYWLYQASLAMMKVPESKTSDAKAWLLKYADRQAFSVRSLDTLAVLAHPKYKLARRFNAVNVADFQPAKSLSGDLPTKPVLLLMAIAEWWSEEVKVWGQMWSLLPENERGEVWMPLAKKLKEARFDQTVTQTLISIISGLSVPDEDWKKAKAMLGPWLKYRVGDGQA